MTVLAICNQKGGVGKTTTAFHLARAAINERRSVLLIDLDPQGNLTTVAASDVVDRDQVGIADALSTRATETVSDVIVEGIWKGLDVAPTSGAALGAVRDELVVAGAARETRLRDALATVKEAYDLILIDCGPAFDQLTINALTAADAAVIVTQTKLWSTNGLGDLLATIETVRSAYNPALSVAGVIVNQHEDHTVAGRHWRDELVTAAGSRSLRILDPVIPQRAAIRDATEAACGLDEWGTSEARELAGIYTGYLHAIDGQDTP